MAGVLVHVVTQGGVVQPVAYELLAAARRLAAAGLGDVTCCVLAADAETLARQMQGADRIVTIQHPSLSPYSPAAHAIALASVIEACVPDLVLIAYDSVGLDLGSWVSVRTRRPIVAYCTALGLSGNELEASSQVYGGKLIARTRTPLPAVALVVPGSFDGEAGKSPGRGEIVQLPPPGGLERSGVAFVGAVAPDPNELDLAKIDRIVCVGRGIGSADKISVAAELAAALGAEIAGSRPVIDSGWLPKARQVGKSGTKVKPKLYIAAGVSGAPEHLEGMRSAECIVAINSDPKAPIFDVAHYGTNCDLFDLLPALSEQLRKG
jgi:electron transfer flavoprotein alpha subunit